MKKYTALRQLHRASRPVFSQHAPFRIPRLPVQAQQSLHTRPTFPPVCKQIFSDRIANQLRHESTGATYRPLTDRSENTQETGKSQSEEIADRKAQEPAYEMTFTCRKCMHRSSHRVTKQAYHFGTTLITCPGCKNRHLISDHLKVFSDKGITIEDILREKGQYLRKGRLGEDGDVEFYDESNNEIGQGQK